MDGVQKILDENKLNDYIKIIGFNWNVGLIIKNQIKQPCMFYRTLFMQEMIKRGVLYQGILSPCFTMTKEDINSMLDAFFETCLVFKKALADGHTDYLEGKEIKPVFRKFN